MVDPISNAPSPREVTANQVRPSDAANAAGAPSQATNLMPHQRVKTIQNVFEKLLKKSIPQNSKLQIDKDENTGAYVYRSVDKDTGEVLSQWPSEAVLALREHLKELEGLLIDTKA